MLTDGMYFYDVFCRGRKIGTVGSHLNNEIKAHERELLLASSQGGYSKGHGCLRVYLNQQGVACENLTLERSSAPPGGIPPDWRIK